MANVVSAKVFRETFSDTFQMRARTNTVASMIAKIHMNDRSLTINNPYRSESVTVSTALTPPDLCAAEPNPYSQVCEIDVSPFTVTNEQITIDQMISVAEEVCSANEAYTVVDLSAESMKEMTVKLVEAVDAYLLSEIVAQATLTAPAIIDAATAKSSMLNVIGQLGGFSGGMSSRFMVMGNTLWQFVADVASQVATPFGDAVLETGNLFNYMGVDLLVVRDAQMPNPAQAIAGIKGAVDLHMDEFGVNEEEVRLTPTGPNPENKISLRKARYRTTYLKAKIWALNLDKIVIVG